MLAKLNPDNVQKFHLDASKSYWRIQDNFGSFGNIKKIKLKNISSFFFYHFPLDKILSILNS